MEKLSLFDLLSFAIPGGTSIALIYWATINTTNIRIAHFELPNILLAAVLVMLAYFVGHLVNEMGIRLESRLGAMPKSWIEILQANPTLAKNLNEASEKVFGTKFLTEEGTIDILQSDVFYDRAFGVLEVEEKLEKVRILQAQYVFFRNAVAVGLIGVVSFGSVFGVQWFKTGNIGDVLVLFALTGTIFSLIAMRVSRALSIKRRKMKMNATLQNFYAYYIVETKVKK